MNQSVVVPLICQGTYHGSMLCLTLGKLVYIENVIEQNVAQKNSQYGLVYVFQPHIQRIG